MSPKKLPGASIHGFHKKINHIPKTRQSEACSPQLSWRHGLLRQITSTISATRGPPASFTPLCVLQRKSVPLSTDSHSRVQGHLPTGATRNPATGFPLNWRTCGRPALRSPQAPRSKAEFSIYRRWGSCPGWVDTDQPESLPSGRRLYTQKLAHQRQAASVNVRSEKTQHKSRPRRHCRKAPIIMTGLVLTVD